MSDAVRHLKRAVECLEAAAACRHPGLTNDLYDLAGAFFDAADAVEAGASDAARREVLRRGIPLQCGGDAAGRRARR